MKSSVNAKVAKYFFTFSRDAIAAGGKRIIEKSGQLK
jgi:hypothetical protein